ncbi:cytochrome P450, partial [Micromonospora fluostatini]
MAEVPEIELTDPAVLSDPFTAYRRARERSPVVRLVTPGFGAMWAVTRHAPARTLLTDPRFELRAESYLRPSVPEAYRPYLRTMEIDGPEHGRLRRLVAPAFTARRAADRRTRIQ